MSAPERPAAEVGDGTPTAKETIVGLIGPIYLPAFLVATGIGMLLPILPLYLRAEGLSYTLVTVVLAAAGVGSLFSEVPVGVALASRSERDIMLGAIVILASTTMLLGLVHAVIGLVVLRAVSGLGSVGWLLSRQTLLTRSVPQVNRGRALSLFGGVNRAAFLIGPLMGGFIAEESGFTTAFIATGLVTLLGVIPLVLWDRGAATRPGEAGQGPTKTKKTKHNVRESLGAMLRTHRSTIAAAGTVQLIVIAVRQGRFAVLPLVGDSIGLDAAQIGSLLSIGSLSDLALFPVAGWLMDRFGRLYAIIPAFTLLGIGMVLVAIADGYGQLLAAAAFVGVGNGIGSGTMLTLGSDLAPEESTSEFLSALGTIRDGGRIGGPLLVGWLADTAGLDVSAAALAALSFAAVILVVTTVGETLERPSPT